MMEVAFADLGRGVAAERSALDEAAARVLESGQFVLGDEVRAFESELAAWTGSPEAIGVASGTDAIELALRGSGIGRGAEVITQANTCVPTVAAIVRAGATPVLCDADESTGALDLASLEAAIGPRTRAIVPVHLYGQIGPIEEVLELAAGARAVVVEDCAQAIGASLRSRAAGTWGDAGAFSFYPTKNLAALGDGGAIVTGDAELAERLRMLRVYGGRDGHSMLEGVNSRLDELQAALLRARLGVLAERNARRERIARHYREALEGTSAQPLRLLPGRDHAWHLFVVRTMDRRVFREKLAERGVGTLVHYPRAIHQHEAYGWLASDRVPLGGAQRLAAEVVSLPLYPELSDAEVEYVATTAGELAR
jgi:dTDP-3-amino-3,4,6-trideoxy-alpha-D-glucose transaminase